MPPLPALSEHIAALQAVDGALLDLDLELSGDVGEVLQMPAAVEALGVGVGAAHHHGIFGRSWRRRRQGGGRKRECEGSPLTSTGGQGSGETQ